MASIVRLDLKLSRELKVEQKDPETCVPIMS